MGRNYLNRFKNQKGQAVLIVLLSLSVVLIIVLYIMSRSVTDISLSSKEENSMRAFSAAEAGIERALVIGTSGSGEFGDATFSSSVSDFGTGQTTLVYPLSLKSGETGTFWFTRPSETGYTGSSVKVCWGASGTSGSTSETPAAEVSVFYKTLAGEYRIARVALDPNASRTATNSFTLASSSACTIGSDTFAFQNTLDFASLGISNYSTQGVLQYMTVKLLYNNSISHKIGIDVSTSGSLLPSQGVKVDSNGSFGDSNRSIEVYQLYPVAPSVFMNSVYSSSGISK